jgi:hypothetical protein
MVRVEIFARLRNSSAVLLLIGTSARTGAIGHQIDP